MVNGMRKNMRKESVVKQSNQSKFRFRFIITAWLTAAIVMFVADKIPRGLTLSVVRGLTIIPPFALLHTALNREGKKKESRYGLLLFCFS